MYKTMFLSRIWGSKEVLKREVRRNPYTRGELSLVSVIRSKDPLKAVKASIEELGGIEKIIEPDYKVLIKPNVGFSDSSADTSPEVVGAILSILKDIGVKDIIIAESAVRGSNTTYNFRVSGIEQVAKKFDVKLIDLKRVEKKVKVLTGNRAKKLKTITTYPIVYESDVIISVPRLKRHVEAVVTISLKNMMGILPDMDKAIFHLRGLHQCIADLNTVFKPDLVVVDATEVMTRRGPQGGDLVKADTIIASGDPVAADLIASKLLFELEGTTDPMGKAMNVKHIKLAEEVGVGTADPNSIEVIYRRL